MPNQAEANLLALIESTEDLVWSVDPDFRLVTFNSALRQIIQATYGVQPSAGMRIHDLLPPDRAALWPPLYRRALSQGPFRVEHQLLLPRTVELYLNPILVDGKAAGVSVFAKDITERKQAEEALRESLDSLTDAQIIGELGSYVLDIPTGLWTSSEILDEIFGIGKEYERTVAGWEALVHPEDREMMAAYFAGEVLGQRKSFDREYRIVRRSDQATRWLHGRGKLEYDGEGKLLKMRDVIRDVTERKHSEMQLRESEERYRATFEQAPLGIVHTALDGSYLRCNARFAQMIGYSMDEIPNLSFQKITLPEDQAGSESARQRLLSNPGGTQTWEKRYRRKDGSVIWVKVTISSQCDSEGRTQHFIAMVEDISARKQAEELLSGALEAVRLSEERYRMIFQTSADGISLSRITDGTFIDANKKYLEIVGYERDEIIGRSALDLGLWVDTGVRRQMAERLLREGSFENVETRGRRCNGDEYWALISASVIDVNGEACVLAVTRDITEAKAAEEHLAAAQEALLGSEARYRTAFQMNLDSMDICHWDDGRFVDVNEAFARIMGFEREEVIGRTALELGIWEEPADREQLLEALRQKRACRNIEVQYRTKDRRLRWGLLSVAAIELDGVACILSITRDITEAKEAAEKLAASQEALRGSEARYRTAFQMALDTVNISRLDDGAFIEVNEAFLNNSGYTRDELIGRTALEVNIWASHDDRDRILGELRKNGFCQNQEVRFRRKDGILLWGLLSASLIQLDGVACILSVARDITELKAAEERLAASAHALQRSEERYRTAFQTSLDCVNINRLDDGTYVEVNRAFTEIMGYTREELIGHSSLDLGIWAERADRDKLANQIQRESACRDLEARFRRKDGTLLWGVMSASRMELDGVACILSVTRDVTEAKAAEERLAKAAEALRASEERYRTIFQSSIDFIAVTHLQNGTYVDVNNAFLDAMGFLREEVIGHTSLELKVWADERDRNSFVEMLRLQSQCRNLEVRHRKKSGEIFSALVSAAVIEIEGEPCIVSHIRDISRAKAAEDRIRDLAFFDPLTRLPNRRLLLDRVQQALTAAGRSGNRRALLHLDMDRFKMLNDTLGHQAGDLLLCEVAGRILGCVHQTDSVARLGADEFAVLLEDLSTNPEEAAAQAEHIAERVLRSIGRPHLVDGRECHCAASAGISIFGDQEQTPEEVLKQAELAMYQAKEAGRGAMRFFSPDLQAAVNARAALEEDLRKGIRKKQFVLYYQPQVEGGRLIGAEALVRWKHPERGLLTPDKFIPQAEESGLILPLGESILEAACVQIAAWAGREDRAAIPIAVNISARQFRDPEFVLKVLAVLKRTGANPQALKLELTESMLVDNIEDVIAKMTALKLHGLRFSLDDFGTGYSSLSYLKRLPLDQLKIDRAFVRDILVDVASGAIAQTLISLGAAMGLSVIAEGVENEQQLQFLSGMGCHQFQGYLFGRPMPLKEFERTWNEAAVASSLPPS